MLELKFPPHLRPKISSESHASESENSGSEDPQADANYDLYHNVKSASRAPIRREQQPTMTTTSTAATRSRLKL